MDEKTNLLVTKWLSDTIEKKCKFAVEHDIFVCIITFCLNSEASYEPQT